MRTVVLGRSLPMAKENKLITYINTLTEEQIEKIMLHLEELSSLCEEHNQSCHQEQFRQIQ